MAAIERHRKRAPALRVIVLVLAPSTAIEETTTRLIQDGMPIEIGSPTDLEARPIRGFLWDTDEHRVQLTEIETAILRELITARGRALSYDELFRGAWQRPVEGDAACQIQTILKRLRARMVRPDAIETVRDIGVRLADH